MKFVLPVVILFLSVITCDAQKINYYVDFPNAAHHEARITVEVTGVKTPKLTFRMSRSSPGRYATHEFGKNVYDVTVDPSLKGVIIKRTDADVYEVTGINGILKFSYTLFGNHADGTYASIDASSIHLNMPATFMWAEGLDNAPIEVTFNVLDRSFTIATQLKPGNKPNTFTAPGLQYFMDSPTKIGKLHWREWDIEANGKPVKMRLAVETEASEAGIDSLADMVRHITTQASKIFGEYPQYDFGTYTFIASINPYVAGDGMEHRNSTMITLPMNFNLDPNAIDVFAHEFFHCWNVERIRPKTLEPFNFRKSNMSNELWCAEGFTQYYGELLMRRSGILEDTSFIEPMSFIINQKMNTPGGTLYSPIQSSNMAVFTDAGVSIDKNNNPNIFLSYYMYGASVALALDLNLRSRFNSSLDKFMQAMWQQHGKTEKPYTVEDMQRVLAGITGASFAEQFFKDHVYGSKVPDYNALLSYAGMELKKAFPGKAWIGNLRNGERNGLLISGNTIRNTPVYNAGLDINDMIVSLNDQQIKSIADLNKILSAHQPGDELSISFIHRGIMKTSTIKLQENPMVYIATYESSGKTPTKEMLQFRASWLGSK